MVSMISLLKTLPWWEAEPRAQKVGETWQFSVNFRRTYHSLDCFNYFHFGDYYGKTSVENWCQSHKQCTCTSTFLIQTRMKCISESLVHNPFLNCYYETAQIINRPWCFFHHLHFLMVTRRYTWSFLCFPSCCVWVARSGFNCQISTLQYKHKVKIIKWGILLLNFLCSKSLY